jgi:Spy/CpxP family protein refolding chaperone
MTNMNTSRFSAAAALLAACLAATCAVPAFAAAATDAPPAAGQPGPGGDHEHGPGHHGFGPHGPGAPGPDMPFGHMALHRLNLSEAQQDKVFAIMHAAAPEHHEHEKEIRKAHEAMRDLARADRFDDAKAAGVARDLGQAVGAEALLHARTEAQLLAVLTPAQREQLRQHHMRGHEGGERPEGSPERR